jgi:hypothetical protein
VNSNWSSGLTVWDWLHSTLRTDVPQQEVKIGVPDHEGSHDEQLGRLIALPFTEGGAVPDYDGQLVRQPLSQLS